MKKAIAVCTSLALKFETTYVIPQYGQRLKAIDQYTSVIVSYPRPFFVEL